jgi:hypothetical protein
MEHPVVQEAQLHVHGAPEAVWKVAESTAPAATVSAGVATLFAQRANEGRNQGLYLSRSRTRDGWGGRCRRSAWRSGRRGCAYQKIRAYVRMSARARVTVYLGTYLCMRVNTAQARACVYFCAGL